MRKRRGKIIEMRIDHINVMNSVLLRLAYEKDTYGIWKRCRMCSQRSSIVDNVIHADDCPVRIIEDYNNAK